MLAFDEATHAYTWNGVAVPSVTQILKACGLIEDDWYTEYSRQRGRAVHQATQFDDEGDLDEETVSPVIRPYVEAARKFKADTGFVPELIESRICVVQFGYAGTLDRLGMMQGKRTLIDFKTGVVQDWCRMQTAAYANGFPNGATFQRYGVQLKNDGTYKIVPFTVKEFRQDLNDFLACVRVRQLQEELSK